MNVELLAPLQTCKEQLYYLVVTVGQNMVEVGFVEAVFAAEANVHALSFRSIDTSTCHPMSSSTSFRLTVPSYPIHQTPIEVD